MKNGNCGCNLWARKLASVVCCLFVVAMVLCRSARACSAPVDTKLDGPQGVAVDSAGKVYVVNAGGVERPGSLVVFGPHGSAPLAFEAGSYGSFEHPSAVAISPQGGVYAATGDIHTWPHGSIAIFRLSQDGKLLGTGSIATRFKQSNRGSGIIAPDTKLGSVAALALDGNGNMFTVSRYQGPSINEYPAGSRENVAPTAMIRGARTALRAPTGVAVDTRDNIYVTNASPDEVIKYAAGANGDAAPAAILAGPDTGLDRPIAIAVDSHGRIYVANFRSSSITEYEPDQSGDAAPAAVIQGPKTRLFEPSSLALDSHGAIYVTNFAGSTVLRFPAGSHGDVAPDRVIPPPSYPAPTAAPPCKPRPGSFRQPVPNSSPVGSFAPVRSPMCWARDGQVAALLHNGEVLLAGGYVGRGVAGVTVGPHTYANSAELYDPHIGTFRPTGAMSVPRASTPHATVLKSGMVLITGGTEEAAPNWTDAVAELYNPKSGTFVTIGHMTVPRQAFSATLLDDGRVLIAGGMDSSTGPPRIYPVGNFGELPAFAEIYDPKTGTFVPTGNMVQPRIEHAAVRLRDGRVLIVGGSPNPVSMSGQYLASAELYDPVTSSFSATGSMHAVRGAFLAAALLKDGRVLVAGPVAGGSSALEIYDPANGTFGAPIAMPQAMQTAVVLYDGKVLLAVSQYTAKAELFDPQTRKFIETPPMLYPCPGTETLLQSGNVLFSGGQACQPLPAKSARFNGNMIAYSPIIVPLDRAEVFHEGAH